jgi:hypothetical protein
MEKSFPLVSKVFLLFQSSQNEVVGVGDVVGGWEGT